MSKANNTSTIISNKQQDHNTKISVRAHQLTLFLKKEIQKNDHFSPEPTTIPILTIIKKINHFVEWISALCPSIIKSLIKTLTIKSQMLENKTWKDPWCPTSLVLNKFYKILHVSRLNKKIKPNQTMAHHCGILKILLTSWVNYTKKTSKHHRTISLLETVPIELLNATILKTLWRKTGIWSRRKMIKC